MGAAEGDRGGGGRDAAGGAAAGGLPQGRVAVAVRARPAAAGAEKQRCVRGDAERRVVGLVEHSGKDKARWKVGKEFAFDSVLGAEASQLEVYDAVGRPVLEDVIRGYHGCILAYGQTGAGKTHSLLSMGEQAADDAGLLPRVVADLFVGLQADWRAIYTVKVGMFQIYNEQVDDLLKPGRNNLRVKQSPRGGWEVEGLGWFTCRSPEYLMSVVRNGRKRLVYAETHMNKHSSRSHAVVQIRLLRNSKAAQKALDLAQAGGEENEGPVLGGGGGGAGGGGPGGPPSPTTMRVRQRMGQVTIVDLAGSERVKKSHSEGLRFKEATNINTSLLAFGNCVQALASRQAYVPYRDSTLTKVLETSLAGNCRTALLVCVAPEETQHSETASSLEFAARAMRIETDPQVQEATVEVSAADLAKQLAGGFKGEALREIGEENYKFELAATQAEEQAREARAAQEQAEREATRAARERAEAREAEGALRARLQELERELVDERAASEAARGRGDALARELAEARARAREAEAEAAFEAEAAKEALEAVRASSLQSLEEAAGAAAAERRKLLAAVRESEQTSAQLMEALARLQALEDTRSKLERDLGANLTELEATRERLEAARRGEQSLGETLEEARRREERTREETSRLEAEQNQLEAARRGLEGRLADTNAELAGLHEQFRKDRAGWDRERRLLHKLLEDLQGKLAGLKEDVAAAERRGEEAEAGLSRAGDAAGALEDRLESERADAERRLREVREEAALAAARLNIEVHDATEEARDLSRKLEKARRAGRAAGAGIDGLERQLADVSSDLSSQQLSWLLAGLPVTKRGRNGRPYRRLLRLAADGQALEWLRLGPGAASQMSLADASLETASEERERRDGSSSARAQRVTVRGSGRALTLEIETIEERLWVEALRAHLESPAGESPMKLRNKCPGGGEDNGNGNRRQGGAPVPAT